MTSAWSAGAQFDRHALEQTQTEPVRVVGRLGQFEVGFHGGHPDAAVSAVRERLEDDSRRAVTELHDVASLAGRYTGGEDRLRGGTRAGSRASVTTSRGDGRGRLLADDQIAVRHLRVVPAQRRSVLLGRVCGRSGGRPVVEPFARRRDRALAGAGTEHVVPTAVARERLDVRSNIDESGADHGWVRGTITVRFERVGPGRFGSAVRLTV